MLFRKPILSVLLIVAFSCEFAENPRNNANSLEAWIYSSRLPCDISNPRSGHCYYYSTARTYEEITWKPFEYELENFGFVQGYYYRVQLEEFTPELPEEGHDDLPIAIIDEENENRYFRVNTIISKQRNYLSTISGTWFLEDLVGFEDKDMITYLKKSITIDPLSRALKTEYNCQPIIFRLKNYLDLNRIYIEESEILEKDCPNAEIHWNFEEDFRIALSKTKGYQLDGRILHLKNSDGYTLLTFSRDFNPRRP